MGTLTHRIPRGGPDGTRELKWLADVNGLKSRGVPASPPSRGGRSVLRAAIGQRLGEMRAPHRAAAVEIAQRARELEDAMVAARRQAHALGSVAEQAERGARGVADFLHPARGRRRIAADIGKAHRAIALDLD